MYKITVKSNYKYYSNRLTKGRLLKMTVGSQVKQAIASLKGVQASFEQFALQTENKRAQQLYENAAMQTKQVLQQVEPRLKEIEQEEPQY